MSGAANRTVRVTTAAGTETISKASFHRQYGWRMTDEERAAFDAGDRVAVEAHDDVVFVELAEQDVVDMNVTNGMTREEAIAFALLGMAA